MSVSSIAGGSEEEQALVDYWLEWEAATLRVRERERERERERGRERERERERLNGQTSSRLR